MTVQNKNAQASQHVQVSVTVEVHNDLGLLHLWINLVRKKLRLAFKRREWSLLGQHLKDIKKQLNDEKP